MTIGINPENGIDDSIRSAEHTAVDKSTIARMT